MITAMSRASDDKKAAAPPLPAPTDELAGEAGVPTDGETATETIAGPEDEPMIEADVAPDDELETDTAATPNDDGSTEAAAAADDEATGAATSTPDSQSDDEAADVEVTTEAIIEALLFSTEHPLPGSKIAQMVGTGDAKDVKRHIETLNTRYEQTRTSFHIELVAKGYQMLTLPVYDRWVSKLHKARAETRLSPAALETLAIIAYKQPTIRAQVESIRGVGAGEVMGRLRDMNMIRIVGRAEEIGRPLLYGTTKKFLEVMGLARIDDLPKIDDDDPNAIPKLKIAD